MTIDMSTPGLLMAERRPDVVQAAAIDQFLALQHETFPSYLLNGRANYDFGMTTALDLVASTAVDGPVDVLDLGTASGKFLESVVSVNHSSVKVVYVCSSMSPTIESNHRSKSCRDNWESSNKHPLRSDF